MNSWAAKMNRAEAEIARAKVCPMLTTPFAFSAGFVPRVLPHGPGAGRSVGGSALGAMPSGTIFDVSMVPAPHSIFGKFAEGKSLIKEDRSVTEEVARHSVEPMEAPHA
jgi:HAE1 family hydrophobic/amphiphilic exporter-1